MANNNTTYMTIPPPPLPEFYLPRNETSSTPGAGDGADVDYSIHYERCTELTRPSAMPGDRAEDRVSLAPASTTEAPLQHSAKSGAGVPPLAVYHICRVCLRPRSARYHQEHPIPEDGLPPPPGICRRCRITPADAVQKATHVVDEHDSNDIKLGIRAFLPDEDYYSNQELRGKRTEYLLKPAEWQEIEPPSKQAEPRKARYHSHQHNRVSIPAPPTPVEDPVETQREEYIYRHVHVVVPPSPPQKQPSPPKAKEYLHRHVYVGVPPPPPPIIVASPPKSKTSSGSTAQQAIDALSTKSSRANVVAKEVEAQCKQWSGVPPPPPPIVSMGAQETTNKIVTRESTVRGRSTSTQSKQKSVSQHSSSHKTMPSEAEIRRLARDEVERYRQAERKLEAHLDPYAHGKMVPIERVPVERRIETVRDVAEEKPWDRSSGKLRRDSGVTVMDHARATRHKEEKQEVLVVHGQRQDSRNIDARRPRAASQNPPSSVSSAKDNERPSLFERPVRGGKAVSEVQGVAFDSSGRQVGPRFGVRKIDLPGRNHDIAELSEHWNEAERATEMRYVPVRKDDDWANELAQDFDRVAQTPAYVDKPGSLVSKWTSQDYWNEEKVVERPVAQSIRGVGPGAERLPKESQDDCGRRDPLADGRHMTSRDAQITSYKRQSQDTDRRPLTSEAASKRLDLPYPQEEAMKISMPSPKSHISNHNSSLPKEEAMRDGEKEWIYVRRTVQPADGPWEDHVFDDDQRSDLDYKETRERLAHRKTRQDSSKTITPPSKRRPSDVSSRVRFSNKLDVSPTPPGSDASSSEFRRCGMMKHQHHGRDSNKFSDTAVEQADRGRSRSRTVTRGERGYYYERDTVRTREREFHEADRDRTPRPSDRGRRRSGTSETGTGLSTMPSDIRPLARAFSESPSRELLRDTARRQKLQQKSDSQGPYTAEHNRSDSVEAFDGSTVTSSSRSGRDREGLARRPEGGRGGRR